jgi:predicted TIM-barrel fold metal-dependent hydrolase
MKIIDVHSHFILDSYLEGLKAQDVDPFLEDGFPTPKWSPEAHLQYMAEANIERCILSLSTPHVHHGDDKVAAKLAREINEETAAICAKYPDKFSFAACLPLPAIDASLEEIAYAYDKLGAVGVKVASNNHGVYLGDPVLNPMFEELDRRNAIIIIHPSKPQQVPDHVFTAGPTPLFEYLGDTTRAVLNMIVNGTLEKYPNIKVIVPHSGSFLPLVIHRLIGISEVLISKGVMEPVNVQDGFKKLYFDIAGDALPVAFDALIKVADPTHIMYGGDFPYTPVPMIVKKQKDLWNHPTIQPYLVDVQYNNAKRLFNL